MMGYVVVCCTALRCRAVYWYAVCGVCYVSTYRAVLSRRTSRHDV